MSFYPKSFLPNNIHVPLYKMPTVVELDLTKLSDLEMDSNGVYSIINMKDDDGYINPYIDLESFDIESNTWLWFDSNECPYRIQKDGSSWNLVPLWSFYSSQVESINIDNIKYDEDGGKLGFYIEKDDIKYYSGSPLMVRVEEDVVTNVTSYINQENIKLTRINSSENKEFYYNKKDNKIYTNLNLLEYDQEEVKIYFYEGSNKVSLKCRLSSNQGGVSNLTPVIDYYILKLHGQES